MQYILRSYQMHLSFFAAQKEEMQPQAKVSCLCLALGDFMILIALVYVALHITVEESRLGLGSLGRNDCCEDKDM